MPALYDVLMVTVTCLGCQERDERIATLELRVAQLEATVHDLSARLGTNATNSGTPPSANPPGAPKPVTKKRTGNKPGGQPGHPARLKRRLRGRKNCMARSTFWCAALPGTFPRR